MSSGGNVFPFLLILPIRLLYHLIANWTDKIIVFPNKIVPPILLLLLRPIAYEIAVFQVKYYHFVKM